MTQRLLDQILAQPQTLSVRFQPIFDLQPGGSRVASLEGLIRGPKGTNFERADILFDYVRRKHAEDEVDRACITAISKAVAELPFDCRINLNVHASTLGKGEFVEFFRTQMHELALPLDRFILEIVEHSPTHNVPGLISNINALRQLGVRIALDDIGLGNSNYRTMLDCRPDYFKVDAFFVDGVSTDPDRRGVVKSIMCLAHDMGGTVIAEGVRTHEDLSTLMRMGVSSFQANLLCPAIPPQELLAKDFDGMIKTEPAQSRASHSRTYSHETIDSYSFHN